MRQRPMSCTVRAGESGRKIARKGSSVTHREGLFSCFDGKIGGISGISKELSAPAWIFYPVSGGLYVFKWEGLVAPEVYPGKIGD